MIRQDRRKFIQSAAIVAVALAAFNLTAPEKAAAFDAEAFRNCLKMASILLLEEPVGPLIVAAIAIACYIAAGGEF